MKPAGLWLCAASTLALAACHRPPKAAAPTPVATVNASPAPAPAVLKINTPPTATAAATVVKASGPVEGAAAKAPRAHAGRRGVPQRHVAHRLTARDHGHHDRLAHGRAPSDGHSAIARTDDAAGPPVLVAKRSSDAYRACISAAHGFTVALGDCYSAELARQGARLNRLYSLALARSGQDDARLQESQSAWTRRRNAECQAGSAAAIEIQREGACRIDMTASRADVLEQLVISHRRRARS